MREHITRLKDRLGVDDWDTSRKLIAWCAVAVALFFLWSIFARVDEVTRGLGKVVPSSKVQLVQAAGAATIEEILVRPGQLGKKGE